MKGLKSLIRKTTPSSYAYICEKTGSSLSDKVVYELAECSVCQLNCEHFGGLCLVYADG